MHRPILALVVCCAFAACGTPKETHRITLRDGRELVAASKPVLQTKTGYYRYLDFQGRDALVRADDVLVIHRQS